MTLSVTSRTWTRRRFAAYAITHEKGYSMSTLRSSGPCNLNTTWKAECPGVPCRFKLWQFIFDEARIIAIGNTPPDFCHQDFSSPHQLLSAIALHSVTSVCKE